MRQEQVSSQKTITKLQMEVGIKLKGNSGDKDKKLTTKVAASKNK